MLALLAFALQSGIDWRTDYDHALEEARRQHRLVLVHYYLADRPVCKTMDEETLRKPTVVRAVGDRFVAVRADIEVHAKRLESMIGHGAGLATCIVDADGDVLSSRLGYVGPEDFVAFLEKAAAGAARIQAARQAVKASESAGPWHALGEEYRACGSPRRAEECYLQGIELARRRPEEPTERSAAAGCHERLARLRIMRGRNLDARQHLAEARGLDPEGVAAKKDRLALTEGLTLVVERRHSEAIAALKDALRLYPDSDETDHLLYALGYVLHQTGQDPPALETLEGAARRFPQSSWLPAMREQIEHIKNPQPDHTH